MQDIAKVKTKYPHDMELKCCERLIKDSPHCRYNNVDNAKTLRRVLQTAKRLQKDAQLIAAVRNGAATTDLTNALKKRP